MMTSNLSYSPASYLNYHYNKTTPPCCLQTNSKSFFCSSTRNKGRRTSLKTAIINASSSDNQTATVTPSSITSKDDNDVGKAAAIESACDIVRRFYDGINDHDIAAVEELIAEKCVYEDLIFPRPFVGRQAILEFFNKFIDSIGKELQFVIDDISAEDSLAIGVTWHLEWKGKPFPFSKGCSFYKLQLFNNRKQIIYARDSVEPAIKPGEGALVIIKAVTWLFQRFPQLADQLK
ncbi:uncharacterized protein LOC126668366 [Mercurialis annua]|uniref:uncharacterized protein LOC126668366 n=1 Tax=Mercurialis annua TaxID=3986 RepID=UPI00215E98D2|nr:uncharacterized protein LOC126668366 [Mercurialis annua]